MTVRSACATARPSPFRLASGTKSGQGRCLSGRWTPGLRLAGTCRVSEPECGVSVTATARERANALERRTAMRIGILSDIHGNLPALEAVLGHIKSSQLDAFYCLGDLVGYAAFPNEVVERIRSEGIPTIMGNYD